jgi:hypothetical protein
MRLFTRRDADVSTPSVAALRPVDRAAGQRVWLDVPFADDHRVKALGGRWDPDVRSWWIARERYSNELAGWLPRPPVRAIVIALPMNCWRCEARTRAIAGVLIDPELHPDEDPWGFVPFVDIADALTTLSADWREPRAIGTIKARHSRAQQRRYTSNGCISCDALLGDFFLQEQLVELTADDVSLAELAVGIIKLPAAAIPDEDVSISLGCDPPRDGELEQLARRFTA